MLNYYFLRFAFVVIVCMLVFKPARADVESIAPLTQAKYRFVSWNGGNSGYVYNSMDAACAAWEISYPNYSTANGYARGTNPVCHYDKNTTSFQLSSMQWNNVISSCPAATPAYTYSEASGLCERTLVSCPAAGTLHSNGYFNVGVMPSGALLKTACVNSCKLELVSGYVPAASSIIGGTRYFFGQAKYNHTGANCTPDTPNFLADFVGTLPGNTCAAGQQMVSMGGVTKCFDSSGSEVNTYSASAVAAAESLEAARISAKLAAAASAVFAAGGSASDVAAAQSVAAGVAAAGGVGGGATNPDPVQAAFCAENPTSPICVEQDFGVVEDSTLGEKNISVVITPVSVGGAGSCPAPTPMVLHGQTYYFTWTTYCNYSTGIKPILLAFAWLSAAGLLVGGFRSA